MRKPDVYNRFIEELGKRVELQRNSGNLLLPGERDLAGEYHVSRKTIRKAMAELQDRQLVYRERKATKIAPLRKQRGKYAYLAQGNVTGSSFLFILYKRLWENVYDRTRQKGLDIDLLLLPEDERKWEEKIQKLRGYDMVFESDLWTTAGEVVDHAGLPLVTLEAAMIRKNVPSLTLDNYSIGRTAAEALVRAGSRKSALISPRVPNFSPYRQRIAGFAETLKQLNREGKTIETAKPFEDVLDYITWVCRTMEELPEQGFDSVFFVTDEWIEIFTWQLFVRRQIPNPLRVIAFDSTGISRSVPGDIATVSNGNSELAAEIIGCIEDFEKSGTFPAVFHQTVKSTLQEGGTL